MLCALCTGLDEPGVSRVHRACSSHYGSPCDACEKLRHVEAEISAARKSLEKLLKQHRKLRTELNRRHDKFILRVPPEVASSIFRFAYPTFTIAAQEPQVLPTIGLQEDVSQRLRLGAVCRGWRSIAWADPRLWTTFSIHLGFYLDSRWRHEFIRNWLSRSGALPLTISVYNKSIHCPPLLRSDTALIDILNQHSDRWQTLELRHLPYAVYSSFVGSSSSTCMLTTLSLNCSYDESDGPPAGFVMQNVLPRPERVALFDIPSERVKVAWDNVTCAQLQGLEPKECVDILSNAPKLQRLVVDFVEEGGGFPPTKQVVHRQLRELGIRQYQDHLLEMFFDFVALPGLREFEAYRDDEHGDYFAQEDLPLERFLTWFEECGCHIEKLTLHDHLYSSSEIIEFLGHFPLLEQLELCPYPGSDCLPDALLKRLADTAIKPQQSDKEENDIIPNFLPNLRSLKYNVGQEYCEPEPNTLLEVSSSEAPPCFPWKLLANVFGPLEEFDGPQRRPLRRVEIVLQSSYDDDKDLSDVDNACIPALLDVLKAGLQLEVGYPRRHHDLMKDVRQLQLQEKRS